MGNSLVAAAIINWLQQYLQEEGRSKDRCGQLLQITAKRNVQRLSVQNVQLEVQKPTFDCKYRTDRGHLSVMN